jgi:hypothetical protein
MKANIAGPACESILIFYLFQFIFEKINERDGKRGLGRY